MQNHPRTVWEAIVAVAISDKTLSETCSGDFLKAIAIEEAQSKGPAECMRKEPASRTANVDSTTWLSSIVSKSGQSSCTSTEQGRHCMAVPALHQQQ